MVSNTLYYSAIACLTAVVQAQQQRNYDCTNMGLTCSNICYFMTCVAPTVNTFTRDSGNADNVRNRRRDCGVAHSPRPCTFAGFGVGGDWTDEFPFASTLEGGRTPDGRGASLLCTPSAEQRSEYLFRSLARAELTWAL